MNASAPAPNAGRIALIMRSPCTERRARIAQARSALRTVSRKSAGPAFRLHDRSLPRKSAPQKKMNTSRPMSRWQGAGIHVGITVVVAILVGTLLFGVWYPPPYFGAGGADHL